jgi:hypothetical protein
LSVHVVVAAAGFAGATTENAALRIKSITIEGHAGEIEIARTDEGCLVTSGNNVVCGIKRGEDRDSRWPGIQDVARAIYGVTKPGRYGGGGQPNATNSMVHDVADLIERVAGC